MLWTFDVVYISFYCAMILITEMSFEKGIFEKEISDGQFCLYLVKYILTDFNLYNVRICCLKHSFT